MLTINVAPDGSGQFTTISEAVLAVPYDCPAVIRIAPGIYREKLAETLVQTARIRAQKAGRPDDITAAVLRLEKSG